MWDGEPTVFTERAVPLKLKSEKAETRIIPETYRDTQRLASAQSIFRKGKKRKLQVIYQACPSIQTLTHFFSVRTRNNYWLKATAKIELYVWFKGRSQEIRFVLQTGFYLVAPPSASSFSFWIIGFDQKDRQIGKTDRADSLGRQIGQTIWADR